MLESEKNVQETLRLLLLAKKYVTAAVAARRDELTTEGTDERDDAMLTASIMLEKLIEATREQASEAAGRAVRVRMRK